MSSRGTNEEDVARRIGLAAGASCSLTRILTNKSIKGKPKSASMRYSLNLFYFTTQRNGLSTKTRNRG